MYSSGHNQWSNMKPRMNTLEPFKDKKVSQDDYLKRYTFDGHRNDTTKDG